MSLIPKKGTVYVVDDDEAVRDSLQWMLEGKDYRVRCFDSAESFLSRFDVREVACLIVDIRMGGMTGLELQNRLIENRSPLPLAFITGHGDVAMAVRAMKGGAIDFIEKPFNDQQLLDRINQALDIERGWRDARREREQIAARIDQLSPREHEVMTRIVAGQANKVIAIELGLSERTVEIHRAKVMSKTGARSLAELVSMVTRLGPGLAAG